MDAREIDNGEPQSLGCDPGHHKEFRNSLENKIHIREVNFRVLKKFRIFLVSYRRVLKGFRVGPLVRRDHMGP
jgi:hypothetical protein